MTATAVMFARPRNLLAALVTVALAVAVAVGSSASFTTHSANPAAAFSSGALSAANSRDGGAVLSAAGLRPGDSRTGTVQISNNGDVSGSFTLAAGNVIDQPGPLGGRLSDRLTVAVDQVDGAATTRVWTGALAQMPALALGSFAPGEQRTYRFTLAFPDGGAADDAVQGSSASVEYQWTAAT